MSLNIITKGPTFTSTNLADFGGLPVGSQVQFVGSDGIVYDYTLVLSAGTIPAHATVKKHTTSNVYDVVVTQAVGMVADNAVGINDTGASVATATYFFMLRGPKFVVLDTAGGIGTVGEGVGLHATTDGECDTLAATAGHQKIGSCLVATSGGLATVWGRF